MPSLGKKLFDAAVANKGWAMAAGPKVKDGWMGEVYKTRKEAVAAAMDDLRAGPDTEIVPLVKEKGKWVRIPWKSGIEE